MGRPPSEGTRFLERYFEKNIDTLASLFREGAGDKEVIKKIKEETGREYQPYQLCRIRVKHGIYLRKERAKEKKSKGEPLSKSEELIGTRSSVSACQLAAYKLYVKELGIPPSAIEISNYCSFCGFVIGGKNVVVRKVGQNLFNKYHPFKTFFDRSLLNKVDFIHCVLVSYNKDFDGKKKMGKENKGDDDEEIKKEIRRLVVKQIGEKALRRKGGSLFGDFAPNEKIEAHYFIPVKKLKGVNVLSFRLKTDRKNPSLTKWGKYMGNFKPLLKIVSEWEEQQRVLKRQSEEQEKEKKRLIAQEIMERKRTIEEDELFGHFLVYTVLKSYYQRIKGGDRYLKLLKLGDDILSFFAEEGGQR